MTNKQDAIMSMNSKVVDDTMRNITDAVNVYSMVLDDLGEEEMVSLMTVAIVANTTLASVSALKVAKSFRDIDDKSADVVYKAFHKRLHEAIDEAFERSDKMADDVVKHDLSRSKYTTT